jgi:hypothetical protein
LIVLGGTMTHRFKVERHGQNEWRIVNAHIGHGLIFPNRALARRSCILLNQQYEKWIAVGMSLAKGNPSDDRYSEIL